MSMPICGGEAQKWDLSSSI